MNLVKSRLRRAKRNSNPSNLFIFSQNSPCPKCLSHLIWFYNSLIVGMQISFVDRGGTKANNKMQKTETPLKSPLGKMEKKI